MSTVFYAESKPPFGFGNCICLGMGFKDNATKLSKYFCFGHIPTSLTKGECMRFFLCILAMVFPVMAMADIASTAYTDNALSTKADDSAVVHKTGNETISGTKTFSNAIVARTIGSTSTNYETSPFVLMPDSDSAGGPALFFSNRSVTSVPAAISYRKVENGTAGVVAISAPGSEASVEIHPTAGYLFANRIILKDTVGSTVDDGSVPNTMWVNDRIEEARGVIPVGGADGTATAQIWIE